MRSTFLLLLLIFFSILNCDKQESNYVDVEFTSNEYSDLVFLFHEWRTFEEPPLKEGAPDYTAEAFDKRHPQFLELQSKLMSIDTSGWSIANRVDWMIVWAEMNGYYFNHRILKPWERDPAFYKSLWTYKSDVPAHEGPTHHATTELWTYEFPLSPTERERLINDLNVIPSLYTQAKQNLIGNAKDLWITGIRDIRSQSKVLIGILENEGVKEHDDLVEAINRAINYTNDFTNWLEAESANKTGPSGIGKDNYTWYLQNVHLVPLSWEDEVMLLKRELARAWSSLKFEEHKNRALLKLEDANSPEAYRQLAAEAVESLITFLDEQDIVTVKDYFKPALEVQIGEYIPKEKRNFFRIGEYYDPRPLYSHFYHWFELARMDFEPHKSEVRRGPLLYNIFDSRNEGTATAGLK